jgi:hypothetical protein
MKILAIEDNRDNLTTLKAVLEDALPGCALKREISELLASQGQPPRSPSEAVIPGRNGGANHVIENTNEPSMLARLQCSGEYFREQQPNA